MKTDGHEIVFSSDGDDNVLILRLASIVETAHATADQIGSFTNGFVGQRGIGQKQLVPVGFAHVRRMIGEHRKVLPRHAKSPTETAQTWRIGLASRLRISVARIV